MLIGREPYDLAEVWHHLRAWAVKGFFCAFMISILPPGFEAIVNLDLASIAGNPVAVATWGAGLLFVVDVQLAMLRALVAAITPASQFGDTISVPPASCTCATCTGVSTVPAPISACALYDLAIKVIEVKGSGEFSGTSIRVIPAAISVSATGSA